MNLEEYDADDILRENDDESLFELEEEEIKEIDFENEAGEGSIYDEMAEDIEDWD